jgi:hypothetical protein
MKEKEIVSYCMECGKIKVSEDEAWAYPELSLVDYQLSHGYCESCGEKAIQEAKAEIAKAKRGGSNERYFG